MTGGAVIVDADGMNDLEHRLAGLDAHPTWMVVLLFPNSKLPAARKGGPWPLTMDRDRVVTHARHGGNIGLRAGVSADLVIHDVDDAIAYAELWDLLGPLADATVCTASGKLHAWTRWAPGIPARLTTPAGEVVGEPRRGEMAIGQAGNNLQMAVCPPSQIDGKRYRFTESADLGHPGATSGEPSRLGACHMRPHFAQAEPAPRRHLARPRAAATS